MHFKTYIAHVYLRGSINNRYVRYYHGTVELFNAKKNRYEYICDEGWNIADAHVICRMLGFPGALDAIVRSEYGEPQATYTSLSNVQCNGTENSIFDCLYQPKPYCSKSRSAGVQCLSKISTCDRIWEIPSSTHTTARHTFHH